MEGEQMSDVDIADWEKIMLLEQDRDKWKAEAERLAHKEHQRYWRRLLEPMKASLRGSTLSRGDALRALGLRDQVHPYDTGPATIYPDMKTARLYARANREAFDVDILGPAVVDGIGVLGVCDLRRFMVRYSDKITTKYPTDPSLPDDWKPAPRERS